MIFSPWAFFPLHVGHAYPLTKALPYKNVFFIISFIYQLCMYIVEHWTEEFATFSTFWWGYNLHGLGLIQLMAFFYFSYNNASDSGGQKKVQIWFWLFFIVFLTCAVLELGTPKTSPGDQVTALEDSSYNIAHVLNHCFLFVMAWDVSSVVHSNSNTGWLGNTIVSKVKRVWDKLVERPLISSIACCAVILMMAIAIEQANHIDVGEIPIFPEEFCMVKVSDQDECSFLGLSIPCHKTFNEDVLHHFGLELEQSHLWTFFITFLIGTVALWNTDLTWPLDFRRKSLKVTCALYAIETSFFSLIRFYWGVSKPLVAAAAVHNLFEWSIVFHIFEMKDQGDRSEYTMLMQKLSWASFWLGFLVTLCLCIPDLYVSLAIEMSFGIMLDFALPIIFISQLFDEERRKVYQLAAAAHTVHLFGTILPLVFAIHLSGTVSWFADFFLEILINLTVPVTHFLYCAWSFQDNVNAGLELSGSFTDLDNAGQPLGSDGKVDSRSQTMQLEGVQSQSGSMKRRDSAIMEKSFRIKNLRKYLAAGFLLGLIPLVYFPQVVMEECTSHCTSMNSVAKTRILKAGKGKFPGGYIRPSKDTVSKLQKEYPGLLDIEIGRARHKVAPGEFFFLEKWASREVVNESLLKSFADMAMGEVPFKAKDDLHLADVQTATCPSKHIGNISRELHHSCPSLWKKLKSKKQGICSWIPGCEYSVRGSQNVELHMDNGDILNAVVDEEDKAKRLQITMLSKGRMQGFVGVLSLDKTSRKSCKIDYHFRIPNKDSSPAQYYSVFHERFVPDINNW